MQKKTADPAALARCLEHIHAFGADSPGQSSIRRSARAHLAHSLARYAELGADPDAPALRLHRLLASNFRLFRAACAGLGPKEIDRPMDEAAASSCHDPDSAARCRQSHGASRFTALQICAHHDLWREADVLLSHGADPSLFHCGVTATGLAAYLGHAMTLAQMRAHGADMRLELAARHASDPRAEGCTLLHRVGQRSMEPRAKGAVAAILAGCRTSYPDLEHRTAEGERASDWASEPGAGEFLMAIQAEAARCEAELLREASPNGAALAPGSIPRL